MKYTPRTLTYWNIKYWDVEKYVVFTGLKTYSDWPTYPQLYANGELLGGLDILKDMAESGELADALNVSQEDLNTRLVHIFLSS